MKTACGSIVCFALLVAACTPNQTARPVTQATAPQLPATMQPNAFNPAPMARPSVEEMSRTRGVGWIYSGINQNSGTFFIHQPTISRNGVIAKAWVMNNLFDPEENNVGFMVRSMLYQAEFDCFDRKNRISDLQYFSERGALGINRFVGGVSQWRPVAPGSIAETNMEFACARGAQARPPSGPSSPPSQVPRDLGPPKGPV